MKITILLHLKLALCLSATYCTIYDTASHKMQAILFVKAHNLHSHFSIITFIFVITENILTVIAAVLMLLLKLCGMLSFFRKNAIFWDITLYGTCKN
jgi:hypothetical protein